MAARWRCRAPGLSRTQRWGWEVAQCTSRTQYRRFPPSPARTTLQRLGEVGSSSGRALTSWSRACLRSLAQCVMSGQVRRALRGMRLAGAMTASAASLGRSRPRMAHTAASSVQNTPPRSRPARRCSTACVRQASRGRQVVRADRAQPDTTRRVLGRRNALRVRQGRSSSRLARRTVRRAQKTTCTPAIAPWQRARRAVTSRTRLQARFSRRTVCACQAFPGSQASAQRARPASSKRVLGTGRASPAQPGPLCQIRPQRHASCVRPGHSHKACLTARAVTFARACSSARRSEVPRRRRVPRSTRSRLAAGCATAKASTA
mmetsp:Transcript_22952/g.54353  ORF Transcript_22952/g.54353 Transcript_22952/m.54353 type:complete len:319 (+) Transcript_22952:362-1318(+)